MSNEEKIHDEILKDLKDVMTSSQNARQRLQDKVYAGIEFDRQQAIKAENTIFKKILNFFKRNKV